MILLGALLLAVLEPCPAGLGLQPSRLASTPPKVVTQDFPVLQADLIPVVVKIELVVSPLGKPCDLRVVNPTNSELEAKALESVRKWTFKPGQKGRTAVAVRATVEVKFRRDTNEPMPDFNFALQKFSSGDPKQVDEAIEILEALSANLHARADGFLGYILYKGMRVKQDYPRAVMLVSRSMSDKNPFAFYAMGLMLVEGEAVPMDRFRGIEMIRQAAALKVPAANEWLKAKRRK